MFSRKRFLIKLGVIGIISTIIMFKFLYYQINKVMIYPLEVCAINQIINSNKFKEYIHSESSNRLPLLIVKNGYTEFEENKLQEISDIKVNIIDKNKISRNDYLEIQEFNIHKNTIDVKLRYDVEGVLVNANFVYGDNYCNLVDILFYEN